MALLWSRANKGGYAEDKGSPVVTQLDEKDIATFPTGRPLHDDPDISVCRYCKKQLSKSAAVTHIKTCLKAKAERTKERKKLKEEKAAAAAAKDRDGGVLPKRERSVDSPEEVKKKPGAKKMAKKDGDGTKGKKRKADGMEMEAFGFGCDSDWVQMQNFLKSQRPRKRRRSLLNRILSPKVAVSTSSKPT